MKKFIAFLFIASLFCANSYADNSKIEIRGSADDGSSTNMSTGIITKYFTSGNVQQQTLSLTASSFNNLTIPLGAKAVLIDVLSADRIILKGVTGDKGISLDRTVPILLPISNDVTTTLGLTNNSSSAQTVKVYFF